MIIDTCYGRVSEQSAQVIISLNTYIYYFTKVVRKLRADEDFKG